MTSEVRSVVTHPESIVTLSGRQLRSPGPDELLVDVQAFSLNRGEVNFARSKPRGTPIGWDIAGTVVQAAVRGGPEEGARVVGFSRSQEGWAERVVLPLTDVAPLPAGVSLVQAAALPVAAGTALACIEAAGVLLGRRVLVTGVTGGVGGFAVQLARLAGATVTAQVRAPEQSGRAKELGADDVVVTSDGAELAAAGAFDLVVDGIGGVLLQNAVGALSRDGLAVSYGVTGGPTLELPLGALMGKGRATVRGLNLYAVSERVPPAEWLARLVNLVESGRLAVDVVDRGSWKDVAQACEDLLNRRFDGKAVLHVDG